MRHLLLALPLFLSACSESAPEGESRGEEPVAGPHLSIVGFDELEPALDELRGTGTLLNFWAMWCQPCVEELPELMEVADEFAAQGGRVVGISYDFMVDTGGKGGPEVQEEVRAFLAARGLALDTLIYDEADHEAINERFTLPGGIPVTLALDAQGNIVDRHEGKADRAQFESLMRSALGQ